MSVISNDKIIGEMYRGITPIYLYGNINEDSNGGYDIYSSQRVYENQLI